MVTLDTEQKPERQHCGRRMCAICRRIKRDKALKVKLMLRRPINQLVAQGIMPPLKTPPAFFEQRKQLERAKTGDLLKAKIQQRPGRDELVRQHILEDIRHVDPSLAEKQRMLKKARLADQLNDQLSHRPGPLELIQKNILHTEGPIERAVKEGHIPFKATCEGQVTKPQHPDHYITYEDDSQSSEGAPSPSLESRSDVLETAAASAGIVTVSLSIPTTGGAVVVTSTSPVFQQASTEPTIQTFAELCNSVAGNQQQQQQESLQHNHHISTQASQANGPTSTLLPLAPAPSPMSLGSTTSSLSPLSNISIASPPAPPPAAITPRPQPSPIATATAASTCQRSDAPGKDKNRKKSKTKSQPKTRTIKFHEYKGPPNAQKTSVSSIPPGHITAQPDETSYELLLRQQQMYLQFQIDLQHKFPQIILPASQKSLNLPSSGASDAGSVSGGSVNAPSPAPSNSSNNPTEQPPLRPLGKLEDMKVSDLKVELKRRNLPVSGSKPQLIERLKPFTESSSCGSMLNSNGPHVTHMGHILMDTPGPMTLDESSSQARSPSSVPVKDEPYSPRIDSPPGSEHDDPSSPLGDDIIREQRKRIEELQRELYKSQQQLQQIRQTQPTTVRAEKLVLQQHIQNKMQQQQLAFHLQHLQNLQQQQQQQQQKQQQHQQQQQQQTQQQAQQQTQQQHATFQQLNAKASLAAYLQAQPNNSNAVLDSASLTAINNKKNQIKNNTTVQLPTAIVLNLAKATKLNGSLLGALVAQAQTQQPSSTTDDIKPPPPQYDEAAKLLKVKIEPAQKSHIKSQVVDDVLEILIKNGELPPSAAQDPATPTTPNRQMPQNLVFTTSGDNSTQSLVFAATSPISPLSPLAMDVSQDVCSSPAATSPPPPPPPPPPLPLATFSVQLPTELQQLQEQDRDHQQEDIVQYNADLLSSAESALDAAMLLSPQSIQTGSPESLSPQEVTSSDNANLDLRELGLDLETLDTMDFGQLECDLGVKMSTPQELMDIGDMQMDMDSDWLDSLMPQSPPPSTSTIHRLSPPPVHTSNDFYDPLLANSQDPFELFGMEDTDFKMSSDLSLTWDKVDFAT
ncbi:myocardin-related transcription factor A-like isoform X2 [Belonocnema kinseyi]|uniref:myocardin-related transcription factor A-like isoform X2 n=1 Tax=Belonocnema kinseyi TaxID=2817044 RepID=UPI00143D468A|nr:myocardin-related transcription factor A-like isoform X2 [Belonocnema kinseyi]